MLLPDILENNWTLFLDRDGVINVKKEDDYIKNWEEFVFIEGVLESLAFLAKKFKTIIIVTNQRGVGKGLMTENDLIFLHEQMMNTIIKNSGRIDKIYYCTAISDNSENRKPNVGMAMKAKFDFPEIDFRKSIMLGDSMSDMVFGSRLNMKSFLIGPQKNNETQFRGFDSLLEFCSEISNF